MDNGKELFPLVDEEGNIIGSITRQEAHSGTKQLHPVVHLHLFNSKGELYLQLRPSWKDWRNREKWDQYEVAVNDMVRLTSTEYAPWTIIESQDKKFGRIKAIQTLNDAIEARL